MIPAILQGRMSSSCRPGKAFKPLAGRPPEAYEPKPANADDADIRAFLVSRPDLALFGGHRRL